jgi:hypothetical protein
MRHLRTNAFGGVYLEGDKKGKVVGKDLFGNDVIEYERPEKKETPSICVTAKLTRSEYKQLEAIAAKFGMSKYQYIRDAIRQQMRDHEMILSND